MGRRGWQEIRGISVGVLSSTFQIWHITCSCFSKLKKVGGLLVLVLCGNGVGV